MYIFLFVFAIILGIFLLWLASSNHVTEFFSSMSIILGLCIFVYGLSAAIALLTKNDLEHDMNKYLKARTEIEILSNECSTISMQIASEYYDDVSSANSLVKESRKYHNNWYLRQFYYKDIADLPLLKLDTIKAKITM